MSHGQYYFEKCQKTRHYGRIKVASLRYSFSGHESFHCRSLWLKKGYDFLADGHAFNEPDAVVHLGVGKNMVAAIRFWLKAFGLTENDTLTPLAHFIFSDQDGCDRFLEDTNTLWLLHYSLIQTNIASLYRILFLEFQRERKEFDRQSLHSFIKRKCSAPEQKNVYNENTVKKDINVLLQNYVAPGSLKSLEDFSALMIGLNLIVRSEDDDEKEHYSFNEIKESNIAQQVILYAILDIKGEDKTVSFDRLKELSLLFCMPLPDLINTIKSIESTGKYGIHYTDNSGIKNVQFTQDTDKYQVLSDYYHPLL